MLDLKQLIILALIIESVWENFKMTWQEGKFSVDQAGVLALSILVAISVRIDILQLSGFTPITPYIGMVMTGFLISRGANKIHDLLDFINLDKIKEE